MDGLSPLALVSSACGCFITIARHRLLRIAFAIALWKMFFSTRDNPRCRATAVSNYANGTGTCHREGLGSVRGFAIRFVLLLVFTGKSTLNVSSQEQVARGGFFQASVTALSHQQFAVDLSTKYSSNGLNVDAGRAWVRRHRRVRVGYVLPRSTALMAWVLMMITRGLEDTGLYV